MAPKANKNYLTILAASLASASALKLAGENSADLQEMSEALYAQS